MGFDFSNGFHIGCSGGGRLQNFLQRYVPPLHMTEAVRRFVTSSLWGYHASSKEVKQIHTALMSAADAAEAATSAHSTYPSPDTVMANTARRLAKVISDSGYEELDIC